MRPLSHGLSWIDLGFQGRPHAIATAVIRDDAGVALVDPGPTTCLDTLERSLRQQGIEPGEVTDILVTHIHLDHAGAVGTLVRRHPRVRVYVHERGAPHMADPSALLRSATRLYGDRMDVLWGTCEPVAAVNLRALSGGERIEVAGRTLEVAYTPGHASHHVSYFDASSGVAFVGDTAGVTIEGGYVLPPTPPPDIDIALWHESLGRIEAWSPGTLFLTHFGPAPTVSPHLRALIENLETLSGWVKHSLDDAGTDADRMAAFTDRLTLELRRRMTESQTASYPVAAPFEQLWLGLARYWRKRA